MARHRSGGEVGERFRRAAAGLIRTTGGTTADIVGEAKARRAWAAAPLPSLPPQGRDALLPTGAQAEPVMKARWGDDLRAMSGVPVAER
mmetsp:Transcript_8351/g.18606  ORF Transcript_8351/g.18606 Transcript_8351/m.18606 type:complete len:89 (+) Transcript_8351:449-715(+)